MTKRMFDNGGVPYEERPITDEVRERLRGIGVTSAPYVEIYDGDTLIDEWSQLRIPKIENTIRKVKNVA